MSVCERSKSHGTFHIMALTVVFLWALRQGQSMEPPSQTPRLRSFPGALPSPFPPVESPIPPAWPDLHPWDRSVRKVCREHDRKARLGIINHCSTAGLQFQARSKLPGRGCVSFKVAAATGTGPGWLRRTSLRLDSNPHYWVFYSAGPYDRVHVPHFQVGIEHENNSL